VEEIPLPDVSHPVADTARWMIIVGIIFTLLGSFVVGAMNRTKIKELNKEKEELLARGSRKAAKAATPPSYSEGSFPKKDQ